MLRAMKGAAAVAAVSMLWSLPAAAEAVDVSTITCKELIDIASAPDAGSTKAKKASAKTDEDKGQMGIILVWLHGYNATQEQGTVVDFAQIETYSEKLASYCQKNPKIGLMTASEKFSGDNAPKPTKKAVDLSTVKCSSVKAEPDDQTVLSIMWLGGWYAAVNDDPTFELADFTEKITKFAEYCTQNPAKGLNTAAKAVFTK